MRRLHPEPPISSRLTHLRAGALTVPGAPLVTALLRQDHRNILGLLEALQSKSRAQPAERSGILREVDNALRLHAAIEDEVFYLALETRRDGEPLVAQGRREHREMEKLLAAITPMEVDGALFEATVQDLVEEIRHHVEDEETQMFALAHQIFSDSELKDLGARLREQRQKAAAPR